jgi:predicted PurR-regulated permease PerM
MAEPLSVMLGERRRIERRTNARVADLTLPELRRMLVTTFLFVIVLVLFLWMVRTVIIASILGVIVATFLRPVYLWLLRRVRLASLAATITLLLVIVPVAALSVYSYFQVEDVLEYVARHQPEIGLRIDQALHKMPLFATANTSDAVRHWVVATSAYGANVIGSIRAAVRTIGVAATMFLFTAFYVFIDAERILAYLRERVPPRYSDLSDALEENVHGVLYGAIYSTFLTQLLKSGVVLVMNLAFGIPLWGVLAIVSFIIGFFPIVGSWSVYLPVAGWLLVFREAPGQALAMVLIGFFVNTLYLSTILRPKLAAERSKVLNFYWMLVGLITGVYTFGLVGILLGPMLIGLLKAILDTITSQPAWQFSDAAASDEGADVG